MAPPPQPPHELPSVDLHPHAGVGLEPVPLEADHLTDIVPDGVTEDDHRHGPLQILPGSLGVVVDLPPHPVAGDGVEALRGDHDDHICPDVLPGAE